MVGKWGICSEHQKATRAQTTSVREKGAFQSFREHYCAEGREPGTTEGSQGQIWYRRYLPASQSSYIPPSTIWSAVGGLTVLNAALSPAVDSVESIELIRKMS